MVFGDVEYTVFNLYAGDIKFLTYEINPEQIPASDDTATALLVELYRNDAEGGDWFVRPVNAWVGYINQDGFYPGNDGYIRTLDFEDPSNMVPLQETLDAIKNDSPLPEYSVVAAPLE